MPFNGNGKRYNDFRSYRTGPNRRPFTRAYGVVGGQIGPARPMARNNYQTVARTRGVYAKGEMKYFDSNVNSTFLIESTNWASCEFDPTALDTLFAPTQGSGISQRIGREVVVYKIKIRGTMIVDILENQTEVKGPSAMRIVLLQDTQTNSTQLAAENVFSTGIGPNGFQTFQNLDSLGRYRILKEKMIVLENPNILHDATNIELNGLVRTWKMNYVFKNPVRVRFNAISGGSVADIVDNSFHILINGTGVDLLPQINYNCRVCYKEQ